MAIQKLPSILFMMIIISSSFIIPIINSQPYWPQFVILHFYFHDIVTGPNRTAWRIASAATSNTSLTGFGTLVMIDDPLTKGPKMSSGIIGRAQGIYGSADLTIPGLLMVMNYVFTEGEFEGSTLSLIGRNAVFSAVREMSIVGGSGAFRFARGFAQAKTYTLSRNGDAIVEYNVTVMY